MAQLHNNYYSMHILTYCHASTQKHQKHLQLCNFRFYSHHLDMLQLMFCSYQALLSSYIIVLVVHRTSGNPNYIPKPYIIMLGTYIEHQQL